MQVSVGEISQTTWNYVHLSDGNVVEWWSSHGLNRILKCRSGCLSIECGNGLERKSCNPSLESKTKMRPGSSGPKLVIRCVNRDSLGTQMIRRTCHYPLNVCPYVFNFYHVTILKWNAFSWSHHDSEEEFQYSIWSLTWTLLIERNRSWSWYFIWLDTHEHNGSKYYHICFLFLIKTACYSCVAHEWVTKEVSYWDCGKRGPLNTKHFTLSTDTSLDTEWDKYELEANAVLILETYDILLAKSQVTVLLSGFIQ